MSDGADNRKNPRFETAPLNARIYVHADATSVSLKGKVVDLSDTGMAIAFERDADLPPVGAEVEIHVYGEFDTQSWPLGDATVKRVWNGGRQQDRWRAIAVQYRQRLPLSSHMIARQSYLLIR